MINSSKLELFCILYIDIVLIIRLVAIVGQMSDVVPGSCFELLDLVLHKEFVINRIYNLVLNSLQAVYLFCLSNI